MPAGDGVHVNSSAKPLVPYPVGISGQGQPRQAVKSRLANSQSAEGPQGMNTCALIEYICH